MSASAKIGRGVAGKGRSVQWLRDHKDYRGNDCLPWPFSKCNGYGNLGYMGKRGIYAHRFMCELVYGPAPGQNYHAAHSCGNGDKGCVNPRHISWKTVSENQLDRTRHGRKATGCVGVLTEDQAETIRQLKGKKLQREIAEMFGVTRSTISWVHCGRIHRPDRQRARPQSLNPQEKA